MMSMTTDDRELMALLQIVHIMQDQSYNARIRIFEYIRDRFAESEEYGEEE